MINKLKINYKKPLVMGILNMSPDSFSDGGDFCSFNKAIDRAAVMVAEGADFIDVGGESTRPGASDVSDSEEASRVIPVVTELVKRFNVYISVNTSKPLVIRESACVGVHLINDVRSLNEVGALEAVIDSGLSVCIMHMQGSPNTMQINPSYEDVVQEVDAYFFKQIQRCEIAGLKKNKLIIDPGFGFGKFLKHNYQLLAHLTYFHHFGVPLLVGISRKYMVGQLMNVPPKKRVIGSIACAVIAAMQGVQIIRVHDVKETTEALKIVAHTLCYKENFFV
ncbi:dihydropteroate synthase [Blochmannia endosymbiont of Camponotus (Colobopsis) obliquus]|uniref:dihydropteroate synthase n=1 Tax=Blochmannia endosymbiont of Camponotus (Colobopsis) obliquus TaxID=1505597 RepID=UPI00061A63FF|nr:dihydropteroate synthase [Blochmannia endosymbiont of Camponotus (Colobopsis) obliquus]AKC60276.1 dihydropteroate synthase [Blochmannia endosymbiont of Camponotus (Colobopsis) obliquus]